MRGHFIRIYTVRRVAELLTDAIFPSEASPATAMRFLGSVSALSTHSSNVANGEIRNFLSSGRVTGHPKITPKLSYVRMGQYPPGTRSNLGASQSLNLKRSMNRTYRNPVCRNFFIALLESFGVPDQR